MIRQHIRMANNSLRSNKVRTFLTLLGIIIGITSVTTIIGLGEGVKKQVNQQISDLGSDIITVIPGRTSTNSPSTLGISSNLFGTTASTTAQLTEADLASVANLPNVAMADGTMQLDSAISRQDKDINTRVLAVGNDYLDITKQKVVTGQFFGGTLQNNNTVILANNIAHQFFGSEDPLGSTLKIRGENFTIIGVLDTNKGFNFGQPVNDLVLIPLQTGKQLNQGVVQLQQINIKLEDGTQSEATSHDIKEALTKNHGGEEDFTITTQKQLVGTTDSVFKMLTGFTAAVASISLLVGGIGVMNIMLVTVTERTKEIGIRKAIGATKTQIMMQFLIEALAISLVGGFIGIVLSIAIGFIIQSQTAIKPAMDAWIILLAAAVSLGVGIIFGTWPAIRAARKDPIEALRHD